MDMILGILPSENYNGIRALADLSMCIKYTNSTAFVVLRNGLPRRRETSSLRPMSKTTKFVGMYVS